MNLQLDQKSKLNPMLAGSSRQDAFVAERCVTWLKVQGFEVLRVESGRRTPRITIRTSPLCEQLEGAVRMYERTKDGARRYWFAIRLDCEVRWTEACPEQSRRGVRHESDPIQ